MVLSRARWWRITPVLFITFSFAYLDRVNYSFAAVGGIGRDLHISASTEALIGALFFSVILWGRFRAPSMRNAIARKS